MSNVCVISGKISEYGPKLRYLDSGKPELSPTLCVDEPGRDGRMFTLYVAVMVYGAQCEPLAESLEPYDLVLITGGTRVDEETDEGRREGCAGGDDVQRRSSQPGAGGSLAQLTRGGRYAARAHAMAIVDGAHHGAAHSHYHSL